MALAGVCYEIETFALVLVPSFGSVMADYILLPALIGKAALTAWLLFGKQRQA